MLRKAITGTLVLTTLLACRTETAGLTDVAAAARSTSPNRACSADQGQLLIDQGSYTQAIRVFTCVIDADPTGVGGYRGRIEAELLLGKYSDAVLDYVRVNAFVVPVHPDAAQIIYAEYNARLDVAPNDTRALTGASFAHWWFFDYPGAIHLCDDLLGIAPDDVYGNLFRGSSRVLHGASRAAGLADLERAIQLAPQSPDVHYVVADAYTYGWEPDAQRAFDEATFALNGGLNTPRVRAILAASYLAFGDLAAAAAQIKIHIDLVTTALLPTSALAVGSSLSLSLVPGRTYEIPITVSAGEQVSIATGSKDFWDTILVLLAPDGTPVVGSDDYKSYFAGLQWIAPTGGTYKLRVTSFEAASTGVLTVSRK